MQTKKSNHTSEFDRVPIVNQRNNTTEAADSSSNAILIFKYFHCMGCSGRITSLLKVFNKEQYITQSSYLAK